MASISNDTAFDKPSPDVIRHLVLMGDALQNIDLGPGPKEEALMPRPRNPWKLTVLQAGDLLRSGPIRVVPREASHIVICVEGGWAIEASGLLSAEVRSIREALESLSAAANEFERIVAGMIVSAQETRLPTVVCTMVPSRYAKPDRQGVMSTALAIFNDRIVARAFAARLPIVEMRLVCDEDEDFASATLLSHGGVRKAANIIRAALYDVSRGVDRTRVYF